MSSLVWRNLLRHPFRSLFTIGSLVLAFLLLSILSSLVSTLEAGIEQSNGERFWVQSAVSLFVDLPAAYDGRISQLEGVEETCRWQWFGGYYKDPANFFAQFAVDAEEMLDMYPEAELIEGSLADFTALKNGCIVGEGLLGVLEGRGVGDTVPITGTIFPKVDGSAWDFEIAGIYRSTKPTLDNRTLFFHWDYLETYQEEVTGETIGPGTIVFRVTEGTDPNEVMAAIETLYENGPQRVQATTEAEFARQFVSMIGNLPRFLGFLGFGVFLAIVLAVVNTMLFAAREQTHDVGVLKALGFSDGSVYGLLMGQALFLALLGGGLGVLAAKLLEPGIQAGLEANFPGFSVPWSVVGAAVALAVLVGLIAGALPAWRARRMLAVDALDSLA